MSLKMKQNTFQFNWQKLQNLRDTASDLLIMELFFPGTVLNHFVVVVAVLESTEIKTSRWIKQKCWFQFLQIFSLNFLG